MVYSIQSSVEITVTRVRSELLGYKNKVRERPRYQPKERWEKTTVKGNDDEECQNVTYLTVC